MKIPSRRSSASWQRTIVISLLLVAMLFTVYWGVWDNNFSRDDSVYLINNQNIEKGMTLEGVRWAFTSIAMDNWHPLTWLSHLLDWQLFGLTPRWPHLINVGIHAITTVLLFLLLAAYTGTVWRSAFVAAIFAVHPLHVESVAWISERKDLLAGLFFVLTLQAYLCYARRPTPSRFAAVPVLFALGLMSKPMLVTLPFMLLLLDWWPLGRLARGTVKRLLLEKAPLLALSIASSVITTIAQGRGGAIQSLELFPFWERMANAAVSYVTYLGKTLWPLRLAIIYPYPLDGLLRMAVAAAFFLAVLSLTAILMARRRPWFLTGWLWYLGMLVPVIGLVQVGSQPMADRYTYLPIIGLFLAASFILPDLKIAPIIGRCLAGTAAVVAMAVLVAQARVQVGYWKNDLTLYQHAAEAIEGNWEACGHVGFLLAWSDGDQEEALRQFRKALAINPENAGLLFNLGVALTKWGRAHEAVVYLRQAAFLAPGNARVLVNLAQALERDGNPREAAVHYQEALRLEPGRTNIYPILERLRSAMR